jgi:carbonic anhydrase
MGGINPDDTIEAMVNEGISRNSKLMKHNDCACCMMFDSYFFLVLFHSAIDTLSHSGINIRGWLKGFSSVYDCVKNSCSVIRQHPLVPHRVPVHGLIIDPHSGKLELVVDGNTARENGNQAKYEDAFLTTPNGSSTR